MVQPMALHDRSLKQRWAAGDPLIGFFLRFSVPEVVEVIALSGADFVILDLEHGAFTREAVSRCLLTATTAGVEPIVRLADTNLADIQFVIGAGARGIIIPHAADAVEVAAVATFARSTGLERGFAGASRISSLRQSDWLSFKARMEGELLVIAQIDEPAGILAADDIIASAGLDAVFLGRIGLTLAMKSDQKKVDEDLRKVCEACRSRGIRLGLSITRSQDAAAWAAHGVNLLSIDSDQMILLNGARARAEEFKSVLGKRN